MHHKTKTSGSIKFKASILHSSTVNEHENNLLLLSHPSVELNITQNDLVQISPELLIKKYLIQKLRPIESSYDQPTQQQQPKTLTITLVGVKI